MATSITSTGIVFPDSTVQTTAAGAGGSSLEAVASGSLSDGSTVIVNSDGTVSVVTQTIDPTPSAGTPALFSGASTQFVAATYDSTNQKVVVAYQDAGNSYYGTAVVGTVSGTSISFGTPVVFANVTAAYIFSTYDSANSKAVIVYQDGNNASRGTAIVGTVSGTSISFGTPVVFETGTTTYISATYDSTNNKVVVAYRDTTNSGFGTAAVGTVSGTAISFGTPVVFESASTIYPSATYDSTNNKVVIAYRDSGNSNFGTAIVGTVSGTSISFGTAVVFASTSAAYLSTTYDSTNQKIVIAYQDAGNSNYGTAVVGTVSGTSISFGTPVVFESASTVDISVVYDPAGQKVVIAYQDGGNSSFGTAIVGTVSGTSISFGTPVVFESASASFFSAAYDSTNSKVAIAYRDIGNSGAGTSVVFQTQEVTNTLTAENFIGISDGAYSDGQTATIQLLGSVDDAQTSLTPGQKYYVQNDGSLSVTPDTPEVLAGTAVATTKLVIKR